MADERKGLMDAFLAPLANQVVDPNGAVTGQMGAESLEEERRRKAAAEAARLAELAKERSVMEAAATQPKQTSGWNPFALLFGDPNNPDDKGLMGR